MIDICVMNLDDTWIGLAYIGKEIVATSLDAEREMTLNKILKSLPPDVSYQVVEKGSEFAEKTIRELGKIHNGTQEFVDFNLATEYISEPNATVLKAAASIPTGYVASYGSIAKVADTDPRVVGQIMASNPLYPIVPCHRVVGSDFSLVGYGGRKSHQALKAKLSRLRSECRSFTSTKKIVINGKILTMHPTENVIEKAKKRERNFSAKKQRTLIQYQ